MTFAVNRARRDAAGTGHGALSRRGNSYITRVDGQRVLGLVAIAIALWSRRGLWDLIDEHLHLRLFPVGYWLWPGAEKPPASRLRLPGRAGT
jgi:hypothetical protein